MGDYSTTKETQSLIDVAIDGVELSVSETLESYATTKEMNAAIKLKTDEIIRGQQKVNEDDFRNTNHTERIQCPSCSQQKAVHTCNLIQPESQCTPEQ